MQDEVAAAATPERPAHDRKADRHSAFLTFDGELYDATREAMAFYNARAKESGKPVLTWQQFVVYGLVKRGLDTFTAWKAQLERDSRLVKTPDELARERRMPVVAGGGRG